MKKILFNSNFSKLSTGFGRHAKAILTRLYKTGKYDIVEYAAGPIRYSDPRCKSVPWKCYGAIPDNHNEYLSVVGGDEVKSRFISYGHYYVDKIIEQEKPDVAIFVEDIWGVNGYWNKPWFNKIHSVIWSPVDSLPTHKVMKEAAGKTKHLWVKADFARKDLHEHGYTHVETWPAIIDQDPFFPLDEEERKKYREILGIDEDTFVIGFVFRNQLRKLVGSLFDGFKIFKEEQLKINPNFKGKILLHTFWDEGDGWNIPQLMEQVGLDHQDVITTYLCYKCNRITVKPYTGQSRDCSMCGTKKSVNNPGVEKGVTESELNIIYNLMDQYCHPMTSGGFEMPILEACLSGLPIATCPYSCGTTYTDNKDVFSFDLSLYRERSSNFLKAQPTPESIANSFRHFHNMGREGRKEIGSRMRAWAIENFDPDKHVKKLEEFIDSLPEVNYDYKISQSVNVNYPMPDLKDDKEFIADLYQNILGVDPDPNGEEFKNILSTLKRGDSRDSVYKEFIKYATFQIQAQENRKFEKFFVNNDQKRLLYIIPSSLEDCFASLPVLDSLRQTYPDNWDIYVATAPNNFSVFDHIPYIKKLIPYEPWMDNFSILEGIGKEKGFVDIAFHPYFGTQKTINCHHNGEDIETLQNG